MRRVYEQYAPGDRVEIRFGQHLAALWQPGIVLRREPPGLWVRTTDGRDWFVTNTYRIRLAPPDTARGD